ncbi:hypothetical protein LTR62_006672 [Meristemomyces frigidus]|uniref:Uncharacterized protein n=1 Tax=Meristemomyces frigidus TaxID=1508187 RepID=A0AAN7TQB9_9PEZI|nr:hypothetical protein LTR62_006672 [Meristemomyces frigidus]
MASRMKKLRTPIYVYLFARYFGAGVIVATAFIHLLDPAYAEIGPNTCVGMTGGWAKHSWPPAIALTATMLVFIMDFAAERYVERKYGLAHGSSAGQVDAAAVLPRNGSIDAGALSHSMSQGPSQSGGTHHGHQHLHSGEQDHPMSGPAKTNAKDVELGNGRSEVGSVDSDEEKAISMAFQQQIAAFLILEFGVIFHSVIIGLTLSTAGKEFSILYPVIVFHQSFESLGIRARLSAIPFPSQYKWMPCFTANIVSGVLDSTSAGILIYTGLVELLARDFLFNPDSTKDDRQLTFMICCVVLGARIMAISGKWA